MKNIVIIDHEPLSIRRRQIFYIDELRSAGFEVEFWDCSQYFHSQSLIPDTLQPDYLSVLCTLEQIEDKIKTIDIDHTIFIVEVEPKLWKNRKFFKLLHKHKVEAIRMWMYSTAGLNVETKWEKIKALTFKQLSISLRYRFSKLAVNIYYKLNGIIPYHRLITTEQRKAAQLTLNHPDWELYKQALATPSSTGTSKTDKYLVFLDDYFPLHPDFYLEGFDYSACVNTYRNEMNTFFDRLEHLTGMTVIIAAHPKSNYTPGTFKNREIVKGRTQYLVQHAEGVLVHGSASISYAVMFNKPTAVITTDDINNITILKRYISELGKTLDKQVINISNGQQAPLDISKITPSAREKYINKFLTNKAISEKSNVELLTRYFASL